MRGVLSLWRFPLDQVALTQSRKLSSRQPKCSITPDTDFSAMTIYNYREYFDNAGGSTENGLLNMFSAMSAGAAPYGVGSTAFILQQSFSPVKAQSFPVPDQCNIVGAGGGGAAPGMGSGTPFYHFSIDFSASTTFLSCNSTGSYTTGGRYFRSLAFEGTALHSKDDTCIYAAADNVRAYDCTFTNIPTAFNMQGSGCALEQCTISYLFGKDSSRSVIISGSQCGVFGPSVIAQEPLNMGGPAFCAGISIEGADHAVLANLHVSDWNIGIDFSRYSGSQYVGSQNVETRNCEIQCYATAVNIQLPASTTATLSGIKLTSCHLAKANNSDATNPVVLIDVHGNPSNNQIYDVTLFDCTVFNMAPSSGMTQHGLQITSGTNIKVIGGVYSNNSGGATGGAGIAITGPCGDVQIIGANLQPSYPWVGSGSLSQQTYALLVSGGPMGTVLVSDCDMSGYGSGVSPISVTGTPPSKLLIYNCAGYNDQGFQVSTVPPTATTGVYAAEASLLGSGSINYFGPSVVVYSHTSVVTLHAFGQTITQSFGIVFLPSPYDSIYFSGGTPSTFSWIGK